MNTTTILFFALAASLAAVTIPSNASAETITIEAVETTRGKSVTHRFVTDLTVDRKTGLSWDSKNRRFEADVRLEPGKAGKSRRLSYQISARGDGRHFKVESVAALANNQRHVVGKVTNAGTSLEIAVTVRR